MIFMSNSIANYKKVLFDFNITTIDGNNKNLSEYNAKVILLVNVASYCGFTKQYTDLQKLWDQYKNKGLLVIGFPSNQFGGQEPESNDKIKNFCEVNFKINFPITEKTDVKGKNAHEIYKWALKNHGKKTIPKWNFHKILINSDGEIEDTFLSITNPLSKKITNKINKILN